MLRIDHNLTGMRNTRVLYELTVFILVLAVVGLVISFVSPLYDTVTIWNLAHGSGTDANTTQFFSAMWQLMPFWAMMVGVLYVFVEVQRRRDEEYVGP